MLIPFIGIPIFFLKKINENNPLGSKKVLEVFFDFVCIIFLQR